MVFCVLAGSVVPMNSEDVNDREGLGLEVCHRGLLWFDDAFFVYVLKNADRLAPVVSAVS
jgi:hypothetical protein